MYNESLLLFCALFARLFGFFLLSPLFAARYIPKIVLLGIAFATSLLLAPPLIHQLSFKVEHVSLPFILLLAKEATLGYFLGFLTALLFEAAAFAGQIVGTLSGFSATELLDPQESSSHPLISTTFVLICFTLFFSLDLHHLLLRLLYESFFLFPPQFYPFDHETVMSILKGTSDLFTYALSYAIYPMTVLLLFLLLLALLSRHFFLFWSAFPFQSLLGIVTITLAIGYFNQILIHNFSELFELAKKVLFRL